MKADLCPVCSGSGKVRPIDNPNSTAVPQPQTCHGCGGAGWVSVPEDHPIVFPQEV